jgi:hypothetical protein
MQFRRWVAWAVLAAFLATIVGVSLEGAWAQEEPSIDLTIRTGESTLLAKGAGINVPVIYSCTADAGIEINGAYVSVGVNQVVKKVVKNSANSVNLTPVCDGTEHTVDVIVFATPWTGPFIKGPAIVNAYMQVYGTDPSGGEYGTSVYADDQVSAEARIR